MIALYALWMLRGPAGQGDGVRAATPPVVAVRVEQPPELDGRLDDAAWLPAAPVTDLVQQDPDEGRPGSERTEVWLVYTGEALYVGARLWDQEARRIVNRLGRRDANTHSDEFRVLLDSYHDRRTAFEFVTNPAGVKHDLVVTGDGELEDDSWDPVWQVATSTDSLGWTVEMRIPFSQLRFAGASQQVWGIGLERWIQRKHELAMFPFVGKTESGVASRFAELTGLQDLPVPHHLELLPYVVGRGEYQPDAGSDPFEQGSSYARRTGLDLKYGATTNLTLDATVNPDFGQVEVDPAYVNLTDFEQFLEERRPFFVEGAGIFGFAGRGGGMIKSSDSTIYFYSRRIGRPPQGRTTSTGQFVDMPANGRVVAAAKLSGREASGWSVGLLDAVTAREWATVLDTTSGLRSQDQVEPLTNYFVGRAKRDFRKGNTSLGLLGTAVHRDLSVPALLGLRRAAYTGGVDLFQRWGGNQYTLAASLGGSYIEGDSTAIQAAQRTSSRYYQRPDATSFRYDPSQTAMSGLAADLYLNKVAGTWGWSLAGNVASPGFEVNDIGYRQRVDRISTGAALRRRWTRPGAVFRQALVQGSHARAWNFDGDLIQSSTTGYLWGQFRNFWTADLSASYSAPVIDDRLTRGGIEAGKPASWQLTSSLNTDNRRTVVGYLYGGVGADAAGGWWVSLLPQVTLQPSSGLAVTVGPYYYATRLAAQYLKKVSDTTAAATGGVRYVFAGLEERMLDATVRVNATFSPSLSLQVYAQPFAFSGAYDGFGELATPGVFQFNQYGSQGGSTLTRAGNTYTADPDGPGPAAAFSFSNPDFRTRSLQVNAVLRWEYRPGSTLYLAWTQSRSAYVAADGSFAPGRDLTALWDDSPTNVLLLKVSYWLSP